MSFTNQRNSEDIKRVLCSVIPTLKDPRISGMLSVVRVDLSGDGSSCRVYVSAIEGMKVAKVSARGLEAAGGFIRHEVGTRLRLRVIPHFEFIADDSIEYSAEIAKKLKDLNIPAEKDGKPQ
ncbi:MAG TPA: 30S ribosome-binding factor RbfA [Oscillospiraceae bacterium]|nr:30S ribosome-binding factor RbfA [Oscillospiraceae bacterium]HPS34177.1 30S ribosome-binding factor RbfA [Oscillospiraceae bacterium]